MKDLSLFLLKNSFGEKMRKGFRTFCNDDGSTSTLNQHQLPSLPDNNINNNNNNEASSSPNYCNNNIYAVGKYDQVHDDTSSSSSAKRAGAGANNNKSSERRRRRRSPPIPTPTPTPTPTRMTLEDMILKLEMEEEKAARSSAKQQEMEAVRGGRRSSCVNNNNNNNNSSSYADNMLLMSARDALNQYPRFSLDGKDAMYRSSFRNNMQASSRMAAAGRRSVCCDYGVVQRMRMNGSSTSNCRGGAAVFGGERVVWCEPGVVAKLMGLEALPMPLRKRKTNTNTNTIRSSYNHNDDLRRLLVLGTSHHRRACDPNPNPTLSSHSHSHSNTTTTHQHHCYL